MQLKSVDKPQPKPSPLESMESAPVQPRKVTAGNMGDDVQDSSRAGEHFLVRGTRKQPLNTASNVLESILGNVDRRKQILETELTPWRMLCALSIESENGFMYVGTGWFAGPRTLITAGHCVFDPVELGGWAKEIAVIPGRNGNVEPFGSVKSKRFSTTDRWQAAQDPDFDYAAIHLDQDLGTTVGHFGIAVLPDAELQDRLLNISGYPVSPGNGESQYFHANRVKAVTPRRVFYDIDTMGGQSGSPVWAYLDSSTDPVVVAIHAYGVGGVPTNLHVTANSGPRILPEVLDVIRRWIQQGAQT
jgi:glutamyl endopeptidase